MRLSLVRILALSAAVAASACHVYDETLLNRDASDVSNSETNGDGFSDGGDIARDGLDGEDVPSDGDAGPPPDGADVVSDSGARCDSILALGHACIEPFSGEAFGADDARLIAPGAIAVSPDTAGHITVSDIGTGRIFNFLPDGTSPMRIAGTGLRTIPTGAGSATATTFGTPDGLAYFSTGDLLIADASAHGLYVLTSSSGMVAPFGGQPYADGPYAVALSGDTTIFVAADNKIQQVTVTSSGLPSAPTTVVGQSCGTTCRGFNPTPGNGNVTLLNEPTGIDVDTSSIYIADSQNCRIRRATRTAGTFFTSVMAGNGCNPTGPIYSVSTGAVAATSTPLGIVGDVRVAYDGTVYFTDVSHCAILAVAPGPSPTANVVAGSPLGCGNSLGAFGGLALGRLGRLGISQDLHTLYFADLENQQIGALSLTFGHPASVAMFPIAPGTTPGMGEGASQLRAGSVSGLAATGTPSAPIVYWAGEAEGRIYRYDGSSTPPTVGTFIGSGNDILNSSGGLAVRMQPTSAVGLDFGAGALAFAMTDHHMMAMAMGNSVFAEAGRFDQPGTPTFMGAANTDALTSPSNPAVHGGSLYFAMNSRTGRVLRVDVSTINMPGVLTAFAGSATTGGPVPSGGSTVPASTVTFNSVSGLAFGMADDLYVCDPADHIVWRVSGGQAGFAAGAYQQLMPLDDTMNAANSVAIPDPRSLAFDGAHTLYIADARTHRIRALDLMANTLVTVAGAGSAYGDFVDATTASIGEVDALFWLGDRLFFGERDTGRVRVLRIP